MYYTISDILFKDVSEDNIESNTELNSGHRHVPEEILKEFIALTEKGCWVDNQ